MTLYHERKYECRTDACPNQGKSVRIRPDTVGVPPIFVNWPNLLCPECHCEPVMTQDSEGNAVNA